MTVAVFKTRGLRFGESKLALNKYNKEVPMKGKLVVAAIALTGVIGFGAQLVSAQSVPEAGQRGESSPEKKQSPAQPSTAGISAEDIMKVKVALKAKGIDPGPITGTMDSKTQQALRQFQQANNLPVTGTVDQQTAAKLGVTLGSAAGSSGMSGSTKDRSSTGVSGSTKEDSPARPGSEVKPESPSAKEK